MRIAGYSNKISALSEDRSEWQSWGANLGDFMHRKALIIIIIFYSKSKKPRIKFLTFIFKPSESFTSIQTEGTMFLFGGYSDFAQEYTHRIWKYLPERHSWTIEGNMLVNRMNFASALGTCFRFINLSIRCTGAQIP